MTGTKRVLEMQMAIEKAVRDYIESGAADNIILDRLSKLENRPRCDTCAFWDKQTQICMDKLGWHNGQTMQAFQFCAGYGRNRE